MCSTTKVPQGMWGKIEALRSSSGIPFPKTLSLLVIVASTQQNLQLLHFLGSNILVENKTKVATEMKENRSEDIFVVCGIFSSQIKEEMISIVANCGEPMRTKNSPISHRLTTVVEVGKEQIV